MKDKLTFLYYYIWSLFRGKPEVKSEVMVYSGGSFGRDTRLSMLKCVAKGVVWCEYHGKTRRDTRIRRWLLDGTADQVWSGNAETYGYPDKPIDGRLYLPLEKDPRIVTVDGLGGCAHGSAIHDKDYSAREVDGFTCVQDWGKPNELWDIVTGEYTGIKFPDLKGIVSGIIHDGDEWIASVIDWGIQSSKGWYIQQGAIDLAMFAGRRYAAMTDGRVCELKDGRLGKTVFNTHQKPQRFVHHKGRLYLFTSRRDEVWSFDGRRAYLVTHKGGETPTDPAEDRSLFDASGDSGHGELWWGRTVQNSHVEVFRLKVE